MSSFSTISHCEPGRLHVFGKWGDDPAVEGKRVRRCVWCGHEEVVIVTNGRTEQPS